MYIIYLWYLPIYLLPDHTFMCINIQQYRNIGKYHWSCISAELDNCIYWLTYWLKCGFMMPVHKIFFTIQCKCKTCLKFLFFIARSKNVSYQFSNCRPNQHEQAMFQHRAYPLELYATL